MRKILIIKQTEVKEQTDFKNENLTVCNNAHLNTEMAVVEWHPFVVVPMFYLFPVSMFVFHAQISLPEHQTFEKHNRA